MMRSEVIGADWLIPAARHKSKKDFLLPLSKDAVTLLKAIPIIGQSRDGPVFTSDGKRALGGYSKAKRNFDKPAASPAGHSHDLRRTARSLMSRAGVAPTMQSGRWGMSSRCAMSV